MVVVLEGIVCPCCLSIFGNIHGVPGFDSLVDAVEAMRPRDLHLDPSLPSRMEIGCMLVFQAESYHSYKHGVCVSSAWK